MKTHLHASAASRQDPRETVWMRKGSAGLSEARTLHTANMLSEETYAMKAHNRRLVLFAGQTRAILGGEQ